MDDHVITITVLVENKVSRGGLIAEHGLSIWIETESGNLLWDTGQSRLLLANAQKLGIDLTTTSHIVISHGHYDHTGGLAEVLKLRGKVDVHIHPHVFLERFSVIKTRNKETKRFIGMPHKKTYLEFLGAHFIANQGVTEVGKNILLSGEVP